MCMTIKEVSQRLGLTPDTLRYYERVGLIPPVNRNKNGIRDYTENDYQWIEFIKCMRQSGLPVEVLIKYVRLFQQGEETNQSRKEILIEQRDLISQKVEELQKTIIRLDKKIEMYEQNLIPAMEKLKKHLN